MKKILAVVLALMMVLSLAACGGSAKKDTLTMATNAYFPPTNTTKTTRLLVSTLK